jgi:hypothetical protein
VLPIAVVESSSTALLPSLLARTFVLRLFSGAEVVAISSPTNSISLRVINKNLSFKSVIVSVSILESSK